MATRLVSQFVGSAGDIYTVADTGQTFLRGRNYESANLQEVLDGNGGMYLSFVSPANANDWVTNIYSVPTATSLGSWYLKVKDYGGSSNLPALLIRPIIQTVNGSPVNATAYNYYSVAYSPSNGLYYISEHTNDENGSSIATVPFSRVAGIQNPTDIEYFVEEKTVGAYTIYVRLNSQGFWYRLHTFTDTSFTDASIGIRLPAATVSTGWHVESLAMYDSCAPYTENVLPGYNPMDAAVQGVPVFAPNFVAEAAIPPRISSYGWRSTQIQDTVNPWTNVTQVAGNGIKSISSSGQMVAAPFLILPPDFTYRIQVSSTANWNTWTGTGAFNDFGGYLQGFGLGYDVAGGVVSVYDAFTVDNVSAGPIGWTRFAVVPSANELMYIEYARRNGRGTLAVNGVVQTDQFTPGEVVFSRPYSFEGALTFLYQYGVGANTNATIFNPQLYDVPLVPGVVPPTNLPTITVDTTSPGAAGTIKKNMYGGELLHALGPSSVIVPTTPAKAKRNSRSKRLRSDKLFSCTPIKSGAPDGTRPIAGKSGLWSYDWQVIRRLITHGMQIGIETFYLCFDSVPSILGGAAPPFSGAALTNDLPGAGAFNPQVPILGGSVPNGMTAFAQMSLDLLYFLQGPSSDPICLRNMDSDYNTWFLAQTEPFEWGFINEPGDINFWVGTKVTTNAGTFTDEFSQFYKTIVDLIQTGMNGYSVPNFNMSGFDVAGVGSTAETRYLLTAFYNMGVAAGDALKYIPKSLTFHDYDGGTYSHKLVMTQVRDHLTGLGLTGPQVAAIKFRGTESGANFLFDNAPSQLFLGGPNFEEPPKAFTATLSLRKFIEFDSTGWESYATSVGLVDTTYLPWGLGGYLTQEAGTTVNSVSVPAYTPNARFNVMDMGQNLAILTSRQLPITKTGPKKEIISARAGLNAGGTTAKLLIAGVQYRKATAQSVILNFGAGFSGKTLSVRSVNADTASVMDSPSSNPFTTSVVLGVLDGSGQRTVNGLTFPGSYLFTASDSVGTKTVTVQANGTSVVITDVENFTALADLTIPGFTVSSPTPEPTFPVATLTYTISPTANSGALIANATFNGASVAVDNQSTVGPPTVTTVATNTLGTLVNLTFSASCTGSTGFILRKNGSSVGFVISGSGTTRVLTLSSGVFLSTDVVELDYSPGNVVNLSSQPLAGFTNRLVTNLSNVNPDVTPPTVTPTPSVNSLGTEVAITLSENCTGLTGFVLRVNGAIRATTCAGTNQNRVLTVASVIYQTDVVTLGYAPGNIADTSLEANAMVTFANMAVNNGSTQILAANAVAPVFSDTTGFQVRLDYTAGTIQSPQTLALSGGHTVTLIGSLPSTSYLSWNVSPKINYGEVVTATLNGVPIAFVNNVDAGLLTYATNMVFNSDGTLSAPATPPGATLTNHVLFYRPQGASSYKQVHAKVVGGFVVTRIQIPQRGNIQIFLRSNSVSGTAYQTTPILINYETLASYDVTESQIPSRTKIGEKVRSHALSYTIVFGNPSPISGATRQPLQISSNLGANVSSQGGKYFESTNAATIEDEGTRANAPDYDS